MIAKALLRELRAVVGEHAVISREPELVAYECDGYTVQRGRPGAVVFPTTTAQTAEVVRCLRRAQVPFVPRGAGTGLSGGATAAHGEVVISLVRMKGIEIDAENGYAIVGPGVVNRRLSVAAQGYGLYFAPDPSSQQACTIGGNVAENAGGPHCLKYGVTTNHVLALEWVDGDGNVSIVGGPGGEDDGYDLRGLLVGSEGTLGIVTRAWVRLLRRAPAVRTILALFETAGDASRVVSKVIAAGIVPAALEMMDRLAMTAVDAGVYHVGYPPEAAAALLIELDGPEPRIAGQASALLSIANGAGVLSAQEASSPDQRTLWWNNRKTAFGAMGNLAPDYIVQDGVIPRSTLPSVLADIGRVGEQSGLRIANVFHAGDGNLHPLILFDARKGESERAIETGSALLQICADVGGSITGEHGVGLEKREDMTKVFTPLDLDWQVRVRRAMNPNDLINPGKLLPHPGLCIDGRPWPSAQPRPSA